MYGIKSCSLGLVAFSCCMLAGPVSAYYGPDLGRWLSRDPIEEQGGDNLYAFTQNQPTYRHDPLGQAAAPAGDSWSRELDRGPNLLDDGRLSYSVSIKHVLPSAVPEGSTQAWQVVSCINIGVFESGKTEVAGPNFIDIVTIGERTKLDDHLRWTYYADICAAYEACVHTLGFDDGESNYAQQTSVQVTPGLAREVLGKMKGPTAQFTTTYSFLKKDKCCSAIQLASDLLSLQEGESLAIDGVGSW